MFINLVFSDLDNRFALYLDSEENANDSIKLAESNGKKRVPGL